MKTFRRDKLLRLAEAGRLVSVGSYHFDDMYGASRVREEMPVEIQPDDPAERRHGDGVCRLFRSSFSGYGRAWENSDGTVTLIVHSNCNYDFRVLPPKKDKKEAA